jgi:malate dehydrogenase
MKISIIGSNGSVGAPAAFYLAAQGLADEIVLIGRTKNIAQQHAMDLSTAVSIKGVKVTAGDFESMVGSQIVLIAAGVPQGLINDRMELLPKNTELMKQFAAQIKMYCPDSIIMTATNPADPMNYAVYLAGQFNKNQVIGYTINDTYRFREFLAREFKVAVNRVGGYVIGEHGSSQVLLFSTAEINGRSIAVSDDIKRSIYAEVPLILKRFEELKAGRTAGWTCAIGYEQMVRAVVEDSKAILPCSVILDGEYGYSELSMSVPAMIGKNGVQGIKEYQLDSDEAERLERSADVLRKAARLVENQLS